MDIDIGKASVLTGHGNNKPIITSTGKDASKPAKVDFGHMPKHTVPCDGIMVRDNGDIVDICIKAELLESRPKNHQV